MGHHGAAAITLERSANARTENDRSGECNEPTYGMHHGRAREIMEVHAERS
jgi:hypothetical protein